MAGEQTFGDLFKAKAILEADLDAAVDAFMADPSLSAFLMGASYTANLHGAVAASPFAQNMLANPATKAGSKRSVVRTAILLARPVQG